MQVSSQAFFCYFLSFSEEKAAALQDSSESNPESNPPTDCKGNDQSVWELPFPEGEAQICSQTF